MRMERTEPILPPGTSTRRAPSINSWQTGFFACAALSLRSEGIPGLTAPVDQPWGMREFTLVDPSGNLVRVGHDLDADAAYVPRDGDA